MLVPSTLRPFKCVPALSRPRELLFLPKLHFSSSPASLLLTLGIRKETKNAWERRVPLTPSHVYDLIKETRTKVYVEPSTRRIFPDEHYRKAGAIVTPDLSKSDVIIGVKEVPTPLLLPNKRYIFFSHTHKGQPHNMPLLQSILDKKITLMDYELLTDDKGKRLVLFSTFAGYAGIIDGMHSLGLRLLALGFGTPFLNISMSYAYPSLNHVREHLRKTVGSIIQKTGFPRALGPIIFLFTGNGNVSQGAEAIFEELPHEYINPNDMQKLIESNEWSNKKIYACQVVAEDYIVRKSDNSPLKPEERSNYYTNPHEYKSVFYEKFARFPTMIINGIYWDNPYPRLITTEQATALAESGKSRLLTLADISCDISGPFQFMNRASTIDEPWYLYDPIKKNYHTDIGGPGIQIMSIDNLPTELPLAASEYFSKSLYPHIKDLVQENDTPVLKRAVIADPSGLAERFEPVVKPQLDKYNNTKKDNNSSAQKRKVLLLGSGYVSKPLLDYIAKTGKAHVTVASNNLDEAKTLCQSVQYASATPLDVNDKAKMGELVSQHDVVVSFVPAALHPVVASLCLSHKKHLVTASYISPLMAALHEAAKSSGLVFMNEIGLDPGIDHLTAKRIIDNVHEKGGRIYQFVSWCGGLPAPENSDNPLGYKFSWSPRGVLLASLNAAKWKQNGQILEIPSGKLMSNARSVDMFKGFNLEGVPNRDSLKYIDFYGLNHEQNRGEVETMFRGTLRYKGFCELMDSFVKVGFMDLKEMRIGNQNWASVVDLNREALAKKLSVSPTDSRVQKLQQAFDFLGLADAKSIVPSSNTLLDAFCKVLETKLVYKRDQGERDLVILRHEIGVEWENGKKELHTSTLVQYGSPLPTGYSAMAATVGLPAAIATEMILDGKIKECGVLAPVSKDVYDHILSKLESEGIKIVENVEPVEV